MVETVLSNTRAFVPVTPRLTSELGSTLFVEGVKLGSVIPLVKPLTLEIRDNMQNILDAVPARLRFVGPDVQRRGRRGRGPCPGCMVGSEQNHHGGSKCTRRGQQSAIKSTPFLHFNILSLTSSGLG
jgi:hypothetical protein